LTYFLLQICSFFPTGIGSFYIGGYFSNGGWKWLNGLSVEMSSTFWTPGQPSNPLLESCVWYWQQGVTRLLDDVGCSSTRPFICEAYY